MWSFHGPLRKCRIHLHCLVRKPQHSHEGMTHIPRCQPSTPFVHSNPKVPHPFIGLCPSAKHTLPTPTPAQLPVALHILVREAVSSGGRQDCHPPPYTALAAGSAPQMSLVPTLFYDLGYAAFWQLCGLSCILPVKFSSWFKQMSIEYLV